MSADSTICAGDAGGAGGIGGDDGANFVRHCRGACVATAGVLVMLGLAS